MGLVLDYLLILEPGLSYLRESISYWRPFQFGYWNEIFRYRFILVYRFEVTATTTTTTNNNNNNNNFLRTYTFYVV